VFVKFVIAGTGAYAFARVIALRIPAALFAGVTFMFSGAFANWVTWPLSDVVAWTGWIAALAILSYRDPNDGGSLCWPSPSRSRSTAASPKATSWSCS